MKSYLLCLSILSFATLSLQSQTAEEVVNTYIENIGGSDQWNAVETMIINGIGRQQGVDYPFVATYTKDGKALIDVDIQGQSFIFEAFDGETAWAMNFQTQQPEAFDLEASYNYKISSRDNIPDAFLNYKEKGYTIELVGSETFEGTDCFKIKLTKAPVRVDGKEEENSSFYFFDKDSFVPIGMESAVKTGPAKGAVSQVILSDYQEVDGMYLPFSNLQKLNGQIGLEMIVQSVEFNVPVDKSIFTMPETIATTKDWNQNK